LEISQTQPPHRAEQLLVKLKERYQAFISQLPPPLGDFARQKGTYFGAESRDVFETPPAALRLPWLFWEIFTGVPDDTFLDVAEGGACFFMGSILLDHLVDGQMEDPSLLTLLQRAFWVHGDAKFRHVFEPDSTFWEIYDRLLKEHLEGLAAERFAQANPETLTFDHIMEIAGSKICPGLVSLAGLAHLSDTSHTLPDIEKALKNFAAGTQFIDDVQDWWDDLASGHLTYFLTCAAPQAHWRKAPWPAQAEVEALIDSSMVDLEHWQMGIDLFTQAIKGVRHLVCPGWTDYVFEERHKAQMLWDRATARHLLRSFDAVQTKITQGPAPVEDETKSMAIPSVQTSPVWRTLDALLSAQRYDGAWTDFDIPGLGISDTWVTAHIGLKLASLPERLKNEQVLRALHSAASFLDGKWRHGWGYNDNAPVDADTTAHALLLLEKVGIAPPPSTIPALLGFQCANGGFATYDTFRDPSMPESWCVAHLDVTPVALRALLSHQGDMGVAKAVNCAAQRLGADRLPDGTWPAFWWILRWYTTTAWIETWHSLRKYQPALQGFPSFRLDQTKDSFYGCTSKLDEALLLECALYAGDHTLADQIGSRLVDAQLPNGLWPIELALCQTIAGVFKPWEMGKRETLYPEEVGIYSAASILHALALWGEMDDGTKQG